MAETGREAGSEMIVNDCLRRHLIGEHREEVRPALERLWGYYRNTLDFDLGDDKRLYRANQEMGLPWRLTRPRSAHRLADVGGGRREVVVENDIAWRIHTLVDFMFGKPVAIQSLVEDEDKRRLIEDVLTNVFEANGGACFFQDMALLGSVYGYVDVLVRGEDVLDDQESNRPERNRFDRFSAGDRASEGSASKSGEGERLREVASRIVLETVEAPRAIPVLDPTDYRRLVGYLLHYTQELNEVEEGTFLSRLVDRRGISRTSLATVDVTEVWEADSVRVYHGDVLVDERENVLGLLPVTHIQNLSQPFFYEGLSEVEALIPLQDELNTRLSDRANRVTMQSFKMYLGKGIDKFNERLVGPGQMWMTDNPEASIEAFGGDGANPSEETHIDEIREAMDKTSSVTAIAAGLLRNKVGNLTSANALRVTLMGLISKTEKKRVTYGKGIAQICEHVLQILDVAGVLKTTDSERRVKLHWPSPLPADEKERLAEAKMKLEIGVPRDVVLAELGYGAEVRKVSG